MEQTQYKWRKLSGERIRQPIEDELREVIVRKKAMRYIMGMGFAFRAKPHAFASSSCANKMVQ